MMHLIKQKTIIVLHANESLEMAAAVISLTAYTSKSLTIAIGNHQSC